MTEKSKEAGMFPETAVQWKRLKFNVRARVCETLYLWAFKVKPDGYIPAVWRHLMTGQQN